MYSQVLVVGVFNALGVSLHVEPDPSSPKTLPASIMALKFDIYLIVLN
jgi:hypothetical protein